MKSFLFFLASAILTPLCVWAYISFGRPPVAVADAAFPFEKQIVRLPLHKRMDSEMQQAALHSDESTLLAGANTYKRNARSAMDCRVVPLQWERICIPAFRSSGRAIAMVLLA